MTAAIINCCVDPRLNHDALRQELRQRTAADLPSNRVFVTTDVGGNFGSAARNTIAMLHALRDDMVIAALLHHDDCLAASQGLRHAIGPASKALETELRGAGYACPVLTGMILTENSSVAWADAPRRSLEVLSFRMPRMYG